VASPIKGGKITTPYKKAGKYWSKGYHTGVDYAQPIGTPVYAVQDGTVVNGGWGKSYGIQILVDQKALNEGKPNRIAGGWAIYAHLSKSNVKAGQVIKKGELIGYVGNTGNSTGAHLHYEVRNSPKWSAGSEVDPMPFIGA
jgi:murein DD-endopeptidase MepM/ murein hydrolase activator NlpD